MNPYITINDIFSELTEENKRLLNELKFAENCLKVFNGFKSFVDLNLNPIKLNLGSNVSKQFETISKEIDKTLKQKPVSASVLGLKPVDIKKCENQSTVKKRKIDVKDNKPAKKRTTIRDSSQRESDPKNDVWREYWSSDVKRYVCNFEGCDYSIARRSYFKTHLNKHRNIRPFECKFCGKRFYEQKVLQTHILSIHEVPEQPLVCNIDNCNKIFKTEYRLKAHKKIYHMKTEIFRCDYPDCQYETPLKFVLEKHRVIHSSERPFFCDVEGCGKNFKNTIGLTDHMRSHLVERNHKCSVVGCEKLFRDRKSVQVHIRNSHSDHQYRCDWPGCEYMSKYASAIHNHKAVHMPDRQFRCFWPQCGKSFITKQKLKEHTRIHTCDKRYACSWPGCQYRCVFGGNLNKHMRVHQK